MAAQPSLRAYVMSIVRDFHLTEDVIQEVAFAALAQFEQYDRSRPFIGWVLRIARNKAVDSLRARGREALLPEDVTETLMEDAVMAAEEATERRSALTRCIERLSEAARDLLKMRFEQNMGAEKIAEAQKRSLSAVRKALTRTRAFLVRCTQQTMAGGTQAP
jgi:RNA polymerase sigma-70 factor (ECF subfamily)